MSHQRAPKFYKAFLRAVVDSNPNADQENDQRIQFMMHNYKMIPKKHREFIFSLCRSYPTPPIYAFLMLGILGTNISRFCAITRPGCHTEQWERAGAFYMY